DVVVVIVVPAFAESHEREQPIVLAGVGRIVAARTQNVRKRIERESSVPENHCAQAKTPEKERQPTNEKKRYSENRRRNKVIFVQPAQFRKLGEVADVIKTRVVVFFGNNPANVRPEKSKKSGRVQIIFLIREAVMMAVMRRPPENSLLRGRLRHERDHELKRTALPIRAVGKITVITGRDEEHPYGENRQAGDQIRPVKRKKENTEREEMNRQKRNRLNNRNARAVRQENRPIARERSHPACSSVEFR